MDVMPFKRFGGISVYKCIFAVILFCELLISASFLSPFSSKPVFAADVQGKDIYVDYSLMDANEISDLTPYIHYFDDAEHMETMSDFGNQILKTETPLPSPVLAEPSSGFEILFLNKANDFSLKSSWIEGGGVLSSGLYNYICLSSETTDGMIGIEGYGFQGKHAENHGATYLTQRLWLCDPSKDFDNYAFGLNYAVGYTEGAQWQVILMSRAFNPGDQTYYYFADIPCDLVAASVLFVAADELHNQMIYKEIAVPALAYGSCYCFESIGGETLKTKSVYGADSYILARVVEAFLTYGTLSSNGADKQTIKTVFHTWFKNKNANSDTLKNEKILDYSGYVANGNSYEGLEKNTLYSVKEKWNSICASAGIDPSTGEERTGFVAISLNQSRLAVPILIIMLCAVGALILVANRGRKK